MSKAYSYLRFSTPEQAKGDSARRQFDLAVQYAAEHGLELDDQLTLHDLGVSAFRGRNAEGGRLAVFLAAARQGLVPKGSYLLVENLDRISRLPVMDAVDILRQITGAGVTVVTLNDRALYTQETIDADFPRLMMALLTFARAHEESVMKGLRVRAAWDRKKREAGSRPVTSVCPSWLRLKEDRLSFEVIPGRGEVVQRIFEMAAAGIGQHTIAATLNAEGVPPFGNPRKGTGLHWHRSYVAKLLTSDAPRGVYVPHSSNYVGGRLVRTPLDPVPGYYPAVVDHETARRARLVLAPRSNPKRGRHAAAPVQNILAGLARCPLCGRSMTRVTKGSRAKAGKPYLVCTVAKAGAGCEYHAVPYDNVEHALRTRADELVFKPTEEDFDAELDALVQHRAGLLLKIDNVVRALEESEGSAALHRRLQVLEAEERKVAERAGARVERRENTREPLVESRMKDLRAALLAEPFDRDAANATLRLCVEGVVVHHQTGQLLVSWRHGGTTDLSFAWPTAGDD